MIKFNELYLKGDRLVIDVEIENLEYYKNMYIDSILIDTSSTYTKDSPSSNALIYKVNDYSHIDENFDVVAEFNGVLPSEEELSNGRRRVRYMKIDPSFKQGLVYVYVKVGGVPLLSTPCGGDKSMYLGVTYDLSSVYNKAMQFIKKKEVTKCGTPDNTTFIDFILNKERFDLALDTGNYEEANSLIKDISGTSTSVSKKNCACNGK